MRDINYIEIPERKLEELEQFIRGSVLGDGSIAKLTKPMVNTRLTFGHSEKQLNYLKWKHLFLENLDLAGKISKNTHISNRYKSGQCISYHFKSKTHPIFKKFRDLYYNESNIRYINKEDILKMDEFALAIWYMDDGNLWKRKQKSDCITLNTQSFAKEDVIFLINLLYDKWNIISTYNKSEKTIRISSKSSENFLGIIEKYKIPCMEYKWVLYKLG